jgi:hypothetical protein
MPIIGRRSWTWLGGCYVNDAVIKMLMVMSHSCPNVILTKALVGWQSSSLWSANHDHGKVQAMPMKRCQSRPWPGPCHANMCQSTQWRGSSHDHDEVSIMPMMRQQSWPERKANYTHDEIPTTRCQSCLWRGSSHTNDEVVIMPIIMWYSCSW